MKGRKPTGAPELALWLGSFVEVSGELSPDASEAQMECSLHLAQELPKGILAWVEEPLCANIQARMDSWGKAEVPDLGSGWVGRIPMFLGFAEPLQLGNGWPLNAIAIADDCFGFDGLRELALVTPPGPDQEGQSYIEYWCWPKAMTLTQAYDASPMPSPATLWMAVALMAASVEMKVAAEEGWSAADTLRSWRRHREIAPKIMVPDGGFVRCSLPPLNIDAQTQARSN